MIVNDIDSPFCPVPGESLFMKAENKEDIEMVIEKIKNYSSHYFNENKSKKLYGSVAGSAIYATYDALKDLNCLGTRIMLLNANGCFFGYGSCRMLKNYNSNLKIDEEMKNYYEQQVKLYCYCYY